MPNVKDLLFVGLAIVALFYLTVLIRAALRGRRRKVPVQPTPLQGGVGFVTAFFDTLGIG
jgi:hypothetical protein